MRAAGADPRQTRRVAIVETIRPAEPSEADALTELHRRSSSIWTEDLPFFEQHPEIFGVSAEAIAEQRVRVALDARGRRLGFATIRLRPDGACELEDLFVEPDAMRNGVGRTLVEDAAACAKRIGDGRMTVVAGERTLAFYEPLGFVVGERVETRFAPALRLWRDSIV
jgi:GNAT superfamily N-acetyltransferase